jgi:hypothetical protein
MHAEIDIAVPATIGPGAPTDISAVNTNLLVMNPFATVDDVVVLEQSFNGGADWQPLFTFINGAQAVVLDAEGKTIRANRKNGSGGAYNIQAAAQAVGVSASATLAVPVSGLSANQDISAQPQWLNLHYAAGTADFAAVQVSIDNVNFAPFLSIQGGGVYEVPCGANSLNVNKAQGGSGVAGNLIINGIPAKA